MVHLHTEAGEKVAIKIPLVFWAKLFAVFAGSLIIYLGSSEGYEYYVHPSYETRLAVAEKSISSNTDKIDSEMKRMEHLSNTTDRRYEEINDHLMDIMQRLPAQPKARAISDKAAN